MIKNKHILFLPEWYPNPDDVQLGIFVEKYARAAAVHHKVSLIFCYPMVNQTEFKLSVNTTNSFNEIIVLYPKSKNKLSAFKNYLKAHSIAKTKLYETFGKPEICHLHMLFRNSIAYRKLYHKENIPFALTEQWSGYLNGTYSSLNFIKKRYYKWAFEHAYKVTAVSQRLKESLTNNFKLRNEIQVLPNIVEQKFSNKPKDQNAIRILVVGDLVDKVKNISGILNAFEKAAFSKKAILTIIGDGIDRSSLESRSAKLNLINKEICFVGRLQNERVLEAMHENHFLITNSYFETFSMVTAEALLAGIPVVCTRCGGPEEFLDAPNSLLIDVDNTFQLTQAIEKMAATYSAYNSVELAQPVLERFGFEAVASQLQSVYA